MIFKFLVECVYSASLPVKFLKHPYKIAMLTLVGFVFLPFLQFVSTQGSFIIVVITTATMIHM